MKKITPTVLFRKHLSNFSKMEFQKNFTKKFSYIGVIKKIVPIVFFRKHFLFFPKWNFKKILPKNFPREKFYFLGLSFSFSFLIHFCANTPTIFLTFYLLKYIFYIIPILSKYRDFLIYYPFRTINTFIKNMNYTRTSFLYCFTIIPIDTFFFMELIL